MPDSQRKEISKFGLRLGNPSAVRESSISEAEKRYLVLINHWLITPAKEA